MVYGGMEGTRNRVLCVAAVEALRLFFISEGAVQGVGGYAAILFLLFSFPPCKVVLAGWQPIR